VQPLQGLTIMALQSLPTEITRRQLDAILGGFPANATIKRGKDIATVYAPNGTKVLSAIEVYRNVWHVMAMPGLITTTGA
jgi:hypothetical protein